MKRIYVKMLIEPVSGKVYGRYMEGYNYTRNEIKLIRRGRKCVVVDYDEQYYNTHELAYW